MNLAHLPEAVAAPHMSDRDLRLRARNVATMRGFDAVSGHGKEKRVHFSFFASPVEILGGERVEGVRMERTKVEDGRCIPVGEIFEVECGLVITCIGSRAEPLDSVPFDDRKGIVVHEDGRVRPGSTPPAGSSAGRPGRSGPTRTIRWPSPTC